MSYLTQSDSVRVEYQGAAAIVVVDNPPVNAASIAVRRGLIAAIAAVSGRPEIAGVVIVGAGRTFVAGADIREFDAPPIEPQLPAVIAAIEACPMPVVAAIRGAALGGGFELALGCDGRVADAGAVVGLPEVNLGLIPGAGGTQRLPRLVGIARAVEVIASGRHVPAREALALGMVDEVVDSDLIAAAVVHVRSLTGKRLVSTMPPPAAAAEAIRTALASRRSTAERKAIAAVDLASSLPFADAIRQERATFLRLRRSRESAALRHLFLAERAAVRGISRAASRRVDRVGVVGLGLMGSGIAASLAAAGFDVVAVERDTERLDSGKQRVADALASLARRGALLEGAADAAVARVRAADDVAIMADADLIIEAVVEDVAAKQAVLTVLDRVAPGAILVSNTSYLDIDALAASVSRQENFAGFHFFSPAHINRAVEVARGAATSDEVVAALVAVARRMGKAPIVVGAAEGFVGNRILRAFRHQCDLLLEEGAYPHTVDNALTDFGMAMGPYAVADLAGLNISWTMRRRHAATRDPRARYFPAADRLCEDGRFGRKSGAGWYRYEKDRRAPIHDPQVDALVERLSAEAGVTRRAIDPAEIVDRAMAAVVNEGCLILEQGIAASASDIDLVMVYGCGFPAARGGPMYWGARRPRAEMVAAIDRTIAATGFGAARAADLDRALDEAAGG